MLRTGSIAENQGFTHRSSFWSMPTMMPGIFGRPMMEGKTVRGASSPEKPACGSGVEIFGGAFGNGKAGGTAGYGADSKQNSLRHWLCRAALHMPLPLSTTRATTSSDMANSVLCARKSCQKLKLGSRNTCGVGRCSFLTFHPHHPDTRRLLMT